MTKVIDVHHEVGSGATMYDNRLVETIENVYAASLEPHRWQRVLANISAACANAGVSLHMHSLAHGPTARVCSHVNLAPGHGRHAARCADDVSVGTKQSTAAGPVYERWDSHAPRSWLPRSGNVLRPTHVRWDALRLVLLCTSQAHVELVVHFYADRLPYAPAHARHLSALAPHLRVALRVWQDFQGQCAYRAVLERVLQGLSQPVILADAEYRVRFANGAARDCLGDAGPLVSRQGKLASRQAADRVTLTNAMNQALRGGATVVTFAAHGACGPLPCLVAPLADSAASGPASRPSLLVSPARCVADPPRLAGLMGGAFGLSVQQQRIVAAVLDGDSVARAAKRFDIRSNTARTHLDRALDKTGARSIAEVVRLASRFALLADEDVFNSAAAR